MQQAAPIADASWALARRGAGESLLERAKAPRLLLSFTVMGVCCRRPASTALGRRGGGAGTTDADGATELRNVLA